MSIAGEIISEFEDRSEFQEWADSQLVSFMDKTRFQYNPNFDRTEDTLFYVFECGPQSISVAYFKNSNTIKVEAFDYNKQETSFWKQDFIGTWKEQDVLEAVQRAMSSFKPQESVTARSVLTVCEERIFECPYTQAIYDAMVVIEEGGVYDFKHLNDVTVDFYPEQVEDNKLRINIQDEIDGDPVKVYNITIDSEAKPKVPNSKAKVVIYRDNVKLEDSVIDIEPVDESDTQDEKDRKLNANIEAIVNCIDEPIAKDIEAGQSESLKFLKSMKEYSVRDLIFDQIRLINENFKDLDKRFKENVTWEDMIEDEDLYNEIIHSESGINQAVFDLKNYIHTQFEKMGIPPKFYGVPYEKAEKENFGKGA